MRGTAAKKKIISIYEITGYCINVLNVQLLPAVFRTKMTACPFWRCLEIQTVGKPVALVSSNWYRLHDIPKHLYMLYTQKTTPLPYSPYFLCEIMYHWSSNEYCKIKTILLPCLLLRKCCDFAFSCVYFHIRNFMVILFHYAVLTWRGIKRYPCEQVIASHGITIPICMLFVSTGG